MSQSDMDSTSCMEKKETTECKVIEHTSSKRQQPSFSPKVLELDKIIEPLWNIKPL